MLKGPPPNRSPAHLPRGRLIGILCLDRRGLDIHGKHLFSPLRLTQDFRLSRHGRIVTLLERLQAAKKQNSTLWRLRSVQQIFSCLRVAAHFENPRKVVAVGRGDVNAHCLRLDRIEPVALQTLVVPLDSHEPNHLTARSAAVRHGVVAGGLGLRGRYRT